MGARLIGENVDTLADVATVEWMHLHRMGEFPVDGDMIARAKAAMRAEGDGDLS